MAESNPNTAENILTRLLKESKQEGQKLVAEKTFAAETVGVRGPRRQFQQIVKTISEGDENVATGYKKQMIASVKSIEAENLPGNVFRDGVKQIISDIMKVVNADVLLAPEAKSDVQDVANQLMRYADSRGKVGARAAATAAGLAKRVRGSLADSLSGKRSFLLRGLGYLLKAPDRKEARAKSIADARLDATQGALDNRAQGKYDPELMRSAASRIRGGADPASPEGKVLVDIRTGINKLVASSVGAEKSRENEYQSDREDASLKAEEGQDLYSPTRLLTGKSANGPDTGAKPKSLWEQFKTSLMEGLVPGILGASLVGLVPTIITALGGAAVIFSAIAAGFVAYEGFKWLMNDPRDINGNPLTTETKVRGGATVGTLAMGSARGVTGTASKLVGVAENAALKFATKPTGLPMTATRSVAGKAATALGTSGKALGTVSKIAKIGGSALSGIGVGMDLYDAANTKNPTRRKLKYAAAALGGAGLAADLTGFGAVLGVPLQIAGGALSLYADYAQPEPESKDEQTPPEESTSPTRTSTGFVSPQTLSTSESVIDSLIDKEGFSPTAVPDGNNMQIGYGDNFWNGQPTSLTNPGRTVTKPEAREQVRRRITNDFEPDVKNHLKRPVTQDQFDALMHLAYNSPSGARKIIAKINKGGAINQADFMTATPLTNPKYKAGLTTRRIHEFAIFNGRAGSPSSGQSAATPMATSTPPATRSAAPLAGASANLAGLERSMNNFFMNTVQNSPAAAPTQSTYVPYRVNPRDDSRQAINTINAV